LVHHGEECVGLPVLSDGVQVGHPGHDDGDQEGEGCVNSQDMEHIPYISAHKINGLDLNERLRNSRQTRNSTLFCADQFTMCR